MNKQGLITMLMMEKISAEVERRGKKYAKGYEKGINLAIKLIEASEDEPQKPVVPQFVVDWYEDNKNMLDTNLFGCIYEIYKKRNQNYLTKFEEWLFDSHTTPFQTLANMHQFGYTVEEEKRYRVKMKGLSKKLNTLNRVKDTNEFVVSESEENTLYATKFTRKELEEAGFGEVFNSPLFEVEEVE